MKTAIVTGANRGLGLALVRDLCRLYDHAGWHIYLTTRNEARGIEAANQLQVEGLSPHFHLLDVSQDESVAACADYFANKYKQVDLVISNAAQPITPDRPQSEQVRAFINTNNHGTYRMIKHFRPLLADGARFLVIASGFGTLKSLPTAVRHKFPVDRMTLEDVEAVMDEYVAAVEAGTAEQAGWADWINVPSKVGQVASVKVLSREMRAEAGQRDILINAVCPGMMDTEASRPWFKDMSGAKQPEEAAGDVVWLATLPAGTRQPYGELVQYRKTIPFEA